MFESDPFFARGGDTGCLLIHGFSGNPSDLRPLAHMLATKGYTVDLPLLPGHGPTPEGTGRVRWRDWARTVALAHDELRRTCRSVVVIGYSMGGALAIFESARQPPAALVLLGVPTFVEGDWRIRVLPVAKYLVRWWYPLAQADFSDPLVRARMAQRSPGSNLDDPEVQNHIRRSVRIPTAGIDHFFRLTRRARRLIRTITVPALIVHGRRDSTALPICAEELYRELASPVKELAWFEESGHQLVTGAQGEAVVSRIATWIAMQVGQPSAITIG